MTHGRRAGFRLAGLLVLAPLAAALACKSSKAPPEAPPTDVTVPSVVGETQAAAEADLAVARLAVGSVTTEASATVAAGLVLRQVPAAGSVVAPGTAVDLFVSSGPAPVTVPSVVGLARAAAIDALAAAGLTVGAIREVASDSIAAGQVIAQLPAPGSVVARGTAVDLVVSSGPPPLPPDPATIAPPLDPRVSTPFADAVAFLTAGADPVQRGVAAGALLPLRVAALRGRVLDRGGAPIPGVRVDVLGQPGLGHTLTRADGLFDLVVNGGGSVTLRYARSGLLPAQRQVSPQWRRYGSVPDVVLVPLDPAATAVDLASPAFQVARGSASTDADGTRRATLLFPPGTSAVLEGAGGATVPISRLTVRATEYTVGTSGPATMPAVLPPTSAYTYAVEYTADEALAAGATAVLFSQPVISYLENFLALPVGASVPSGWYDPARGAWVPDQDGRVVAVVGSDATGATLDVDGSGAASPPSALAALGIADGERATLASLYAAGQQLWRVPVRRFSPHDANLMDSAPPGGATPPDVSLPELDLEQLDPDEPCVEAGSVVACERRAVGERIPVQGTPFTLNHWSDRAAGYRASMRLDLPLTGATPPAELLRVEVAASAMGREIRQSFAPAPNLSTTLRWEPLDRFGRKVSGSQPLELQVTYVYPAYYWVGTAPPGYVSFMARPGELGPGQRTALVPRPPRTFPWTTYVRSEIYAGRPGPALQRLGGWTLDVHHQYDPEGRTLYLGDGRRRGVSGSRLSRLVERLPAWPPPGFSSTDGPAGLVAAPDGALFVSTGFHADVRRIDPDGSMTIVAGTGTPGYSGDGGPATSAQLQRADDLALGPDGSLFVKDQYRIRRVDPGGTITTFAGDGTFGTPQWGKPATQSPIGAPQGIAAAADGSLYVATTGGIARIAADGLLARAVTSSTSGACNVRPPLSTSLANACFFGQASFVATDSNGGLYVADDHYIRRISRDGIVTLLAGFPTFPSAPAPVGGPAIDARITTGPLQVGADGSVHFVDLGGLRRIRPDGILLAVEGVQFGASPPEGQPALAAEPLGGPFALGPDGTAYAVSRTGRPTLYRVTPPLPGPESKDLFVASEDGEEVYVFDASGRHLRTVRALGNAVRWSFGYTAGGDLDTITDGSGNVTRVLRDAAGNPTGIRAPFGQVTALSVDAAGNLASLADQAGNAYSLSAGAGGLLSALTDPRGNVHAFSYDTDGQLATDQDPAGGTKTLATPVQTYTSKVTTTTTALGRVTSYGVTTLTSGDTRRTVTDPAGLATVETTTGVRTVTASPDGTVVTRVLGPDPRWRMQAPVAASTTVQLPSGTTRTVTQSRAVTFADASSLFALATWVETVKVNGRAWTSRYDAATRTLTTTSPAGRVSTTVLDAQGRTVSAARPGMLPVQLAYDAKGLLTGVTQGARTYTTVFDALGRATGLTDPTNLTTTFAWDSADRLASTTRPDGQVIAFAHDASGNLTSVTPPGRSAHALAYSPIDALASYTPPALTGAGPTAYAHDADHLLASVALPDASTVAVAYDPGGRVVSVTQARGTTTYAYAAGGQVASIAAPDGGVIAYAWDGSVATSVTFTGDVSGSVQRSYDADFHVASESVNGTSGVAFVRDLDGLLTGAGALTLARDAASGLVTGTALDTVADTSTYDGFGAVASYSATAGATALAAFQYGRDALGRVAAVDETIAGASRVLQYRYDAAGRLDQVTTDGTVTASYAYDANGNRTGASAGGTSVSATYDAQDRLAAYGNVAFTYDALGQLATRTDGTAVTQLAYDAVGNLVTAILPGGTRLDYVVDGRNRRIGKKVGGTLVQGFLYGDQLRPVAELDGTGAVVSRFVYAGGLSAPAYLVKGGTAYRVVSDHLGSARLVVNASTGAVVQRLDYDAFGKVTADTNPGFQPFGFAGGLYDRDTGFVRFGARDYDPVTGRWTAKDPLRFDAGDANLYAYVSGDPVNQADPTGLGGCSKLKKQERRRRLKTELPAIVVDPHDPENRGRAKVRVPGLDRPDVWITLPKVIDDPGSGHVCWEFPCGEYRPTTYQPLPVDVGDEVIVRFSDDGPPEYGEPELTGDPDRPVFVTLGRPRM